MNKQQWILVAALALVATFSRAQTVEYIHTDALGSPVAVTNASGAVIERTVYEPYGAVINRSLTNGPGYTGHVEDAVTGLNYMQQRYYDPGLGRFLSVDPITAASVGGNFNRYWYGNNNPYKYIDPDGRCTGSILVNKDGTCKTTGGYTADTRGMALGMALRHVTAQVETISVAVEDLQEALDDAAEKIQEFLPAEGIRQAPNPKSPLGRLFEAARRASQSVSRWYPPWLRGILVHNRFRDYVRALGPEYAAEVSYYKGREVRYGYPGSVRADAIFGPRGAPSFAVELKTGGAYVTRGEQDAYETHLPDNVPLYQIRER